MELWGIIILLKRYKLERRKQKNGQRRSKMKRVVRSISKSI